MLCSEAIELLKEDGTLIFDIANGPGGQSEQLEALRDSNVFLRAKPGTDPGPQMHSYLRNDCIARVSLFCTRRECWAMVDCLLGIAPSYSTWCSSYQWQKGEGPADITVPKVRDFCYVGWYDRFCGNRRMLLSKPSASLYQQNAVIPFAQQVNKFGEDNNQ